MATDIERIIELFKGSHPDGNVAQLKVKYPGADDDGLWFFNSPGVKTQVQLESSYGCCPFLIESDRHPERFNADTIEDAVRLLHQELRD